MVKIGRNEPCSCGSGKKYKKCCLFQEASNQTDQSNTQWIKKLKSDYAKKDISIIDGNKLGVLKMSDVILDFSDEILLNTPDELQRQKSVLNLVIIAWNIALLPEEKQEENIRHFIEKLQIESCDEQDFADILKTLILKKRAEYPMINRYILNYDFVATKNGKHLNVVSTIYA